MQTKKNANYRYRHLPTRASSPLSDAKWSGVLFLSATRASSEQAPRAPSPELVSTEAVEGPNVPVSAEEQLAPDSSRQREGGGFSAELNDPADPSPLNNDSSITPLVSALLPILLPMGSGENASRLSSLPSGGELDRGDKGDEGPVLLVGLGS